MKLDRIGLKKAIWCLKVPFFRSLLGVNGLNLYASYIITIKLIMPPMLSFLPGTFFVNATLRFYGIDL